MVRQVSGYIQRALGHLPRAGSHRPWRLHDNYLRCGIRHRDDLGQMRKYDPAFTGIQPRF